MATSPPDTPKGAANGRVRGLVRRTAATVAAGARPRPIAFYLALAAAMLVAIAANQVWTLADTSVKASSLDIAVRARLSSPKADPGILLVDIDERSLAALAPKYGRWPWPRSVLAEGLAGLSAAGAKSVALNVMLSDPDLAHPEDDATFNDVAAHTPNLVFPISRLDPANDARSEVAITAFAGARITDPAKAQKPIAVLAPAFPGARDKLGFNQLRVDPDGAIRRYDPWASGDGFAFPSLPLRALTAAGERPAITPDSFPKGMILNWRNKQGGYARMSFSDALERLDRGDAGAVAPFKDKIIIIGPTAPGLATLKGTAAAPVMDDNLILATAVDDMRHGTQLRLIPAWATALVSSLAVLGLALAFILRVDSGLINGLFVALQTGFIGVTVYLASYTHYLVDISTTLLFALAYFTVAKVYASIHLNAVRGHPVFSDRFLTHDSRAFIVLALSPRLARPRQIRALLRLLEKAAGPRRVLHVDNLFGTGHLLEPPTRGLSFILVAMERAGAELPPYVDSAISRSGVHPLVEAIPLAGDAATPVEERFKPLFQALLGLTQKLI